MALDPSELRRLTTRSLQSRRPCLVVDDDEPVNLPPVIVQTLAEVIEILYRERPALISDGTCKRPAGRSNDMG